MKVNSISNTQYHNQNFGVGVSKRAVKDIALLVKTGVISADSELLQKIKNIQGNFILKRLFVQKAKAPSKSLFATCDITSATVDGYFKHIHKKGGLDIPAQELCYFLPETLAKPEQQLSTDTIIYAIKENIEEICKSYMYKQARKGELKGQLKLLKEEFPESNINAYYEKYKNIDTARAKRKQDFINFIIQHPIIAKLSFGINPSPTYYK